jgi:hypothetical protein
MVAVSLEAKKLRLNPPIPKPSNEPIEAR